MCVHHPTKRVFLFFMGAFYRSRSNTARMDSFKGYFNDKSIQRQFFRKLLTVMSQVFIVLAVWEFIKSSNESPDGADELLIQLSRRSANPLDCFQKYSHGERLEIEHIISRGNKLNRSGDKENKLFLAVDIFVRSVGSDSFIIYPVGTPVSLGDVEVDKENQMSKMDYLEYNDEDISKNVINNDLSDKKQNPLSHLEPFTGSERGKNKTIKSPIIESKTKLVLGLDSNDTRADTIKQEAMQAENRVIDVMLVEDQMLKIRPQDQLEQKEILQLIQKKRDVRSWLLKKARQLNDESLQRRRNNSQSAKYQTAYLERHQQTTVVQAEKKRLDIVMQNRTVDRLHAWPEVVLDETSEPLFADGFLERVQKVKAELYSQPMFYDHKLKGKVRKYYLLNNPLLCSAVEKVDIVYLIHSQPHSKEHRQRLRETIVKSDRFKPFTVVHVFLVGKTTVVQFQEDLRLESQLYGDIVQGDFEDKLEHNVWKGLMGMRWVLQFCRKVNIVLKINEDVFVDTDKLLRGLIPVSTSIIGKRAMFCALSPGGSNKTNNLNLARPFCAGFAVVMTRHLVCSILAASHQIRVPSIEDYYLYGILPFAIGGVEVYNLSSNLGFQMYGVQAVRCFRDQQDGCPIVAAQSLFSRFASLWKMIATREDKPDGWSALWDLQNVKSYFS